MHVFIHILRGVEKELKKGTLSTLIKLKQEVKQKLLLQRHTLHQREPSGERPEAGSCL